MKRIFFTIAATFGIGLATACAAMDSTAPIIASGKVQPVFTENGCIKEMSWTRPGSAPVDMVFRQDKYAGFSFHVENNGKWDTQLPLVRVQPGRDEFALNRNGIIYSIAYAVKDDRLAVVAKIKNDSGQPFSPARALVNIGVDIEMVKFPEWNQRFFPTLLRCEKTHFWGYFMRPDGIILGIASPDPVVSWANGYNYGGHRIFTSCLDLLNKNPQPARHPQVNITLAPGETRQWTIFLVPLDTLAEIQPVLSRVAGIPMIALERPTIEAGQKVRGTLSASASPVQSLIITDADGKAVACKRTGNDFSFTLESPGVCVIQAKTTDGRIAEATVSCRLPWSWYAKHARANAVAKPQKGGSHTEGWYGLFSGYIARRYFPDAKLDAELDATFKEITPLMYDMKTMKPLTAPPAGKLIHRVQNHACFISVLVARYRADGDIRNLEFASSLADFLISCQGKDGAYRSGRTHYTSVVYMGKSMMELLATERTLASKDPVWKERYARHADSVKRAMDELALHLDDIQTEGEMTYEDGMISCSYTQLAMYALLQEDAAQRQKYLEAARKLASGHRCLSQILIPDSRMNGGSLRYWESQYDINTSGVNMMNSPHGWSAWRLYGLWYLYQLTGEKEYLRQAMNGLGSCAQLVDFKTGDLRWAFIQDPCISTKLFEEIPEKPGHGRHVPRIVGEQYLPMISGWYRAVPNTWTVGYLSMAGYHPAGTLGGCCDNDVHEIFKCLGEIALTSAYVVENANGSLETWNCRATRNPEGVIAVVPAEAVVSRVHFNLKQPAATHIQFSTGKQEASLPAGLTWSGPGGVPEELRR